MKKYWSELFLVVSALIVGSFGAYFYMNNDHTTTDHVSCISNDKEITYKFGFDEETHVFEEYPIKSGSFIGDMLLAQSINFDKILELEKKSEKVFSLRKLMAGKYITFIKDDECSRPKSFIYAPDLFSYIEYNIGDSVHVSKKEIPFEVCVDVLTGIIKKGSSLSESLSDQGQNIAMADQLEDALAQVYFPHAQPGDQYKVIYEKKYIEGKPVDNGNILAASYKSGNSESFGIFYENDHYSGFYDLEGTPNKKTFLRAPLRASRISSYYSMNRLHPVKKVRRAHLGTDYAAPTGTEIFAVADGVITKRGYTSGNGNYVKIRHNNIYETQYLHMSRFKSGLSVGSRVKQSQVIGYVGSTGLATGPHVCFRFWKNGKQINHLRENFPPSNPMPTESLPEYYEYRDVLVKYLETVPYKGETYAYADLSSIEQTQAEP